MHASSNRTSNYQYMKPNWSNYKEKLARPQLWSEISTPFSQKWSEQADIKYVRIFHVQGGLLLPEYTFSWTALIWFEILNNLRNPSHIFKSALSIGPFSSIFKLLQIWSTLKTPSTKLSSPPFLNSQNYCNMCLNFLSPFLCLPLFLQPNTLPPGIDLVLY